ALPLIGYVAGLALGGWRAALGLISIAVLLLATRRFRAAIICLAIAAGSAAAAHRANVRQSESHALQILHRDKFVTIVAPIDSGWSLRRDVFALRVSSFAVRGSQFEHPLTISARVVPRPIAMAETIVAEVFLHPHGRWEFTLLLASPQLMGYLRGLVDLS